MKKIMFIAAMVAMLASCNNGDDDGKQQQNDGSLKVEIKVAIDSQTDYSEVASVGAVMNGENGDTIIASVPWNGGNVTIILPKDVSEDLLSVMSENEQGGAIFSDPENKTASMEFQLFNDMNKSIGVLEPFYEDYNFTTMKAEAAECMYIYSDRQFTITGSEFGNNEGIIYDLTMNKGWNCVYTHMTADIVDFIDEEDFGVANNKMTMTNIKPDNAVFVWYAYTY